jgi:uncharacterized cupredoxin-like copper-binding protein
MRLASGITILLIVGACSSGTQLSTNIAASATEFAFAPTAWTVQAGKGITIAFDNKGAVEHEWVIIKDQRQLATEAEFTEDLVYFEVEATPPGQSATETFTAPAAGIYQIICALPGHFSGGMKGTLTVAP